MARGLTETQINAFRSWGWSREQIAAFCVKTEARQARERSERAKQAAITRELGKRGRKSTRQAANV